MEVFVIGMTRVTTGLDILSSASGHPGHDNTVVSESKLARHLWNIVTMTIRRGT